ncbi:MAG TPA: hypothetical protein VIP77_22455 [Jiangellaceae bacterium]
MGIQRTIYIRDDDVTLWEWAETYARQRRMPVSGLVMTSLERYRAEVDDSQPED